MPRSRAVARTSRAVALLSTAALVMAVPVVLPTVAAAAEPTAVTVAGSLQSELGCAADWQPDCAETDLAYDAAHGLDRLVRAARRQLRVQDRDRSQLGRELRRRRRRERLEHPAGAASRP